MHDKQQKLLGLLLGVSTLLLVLSFLNILQKNSSEDGIITDIFETNLDEFIIDLRRTLLQGHRKHKDLFPLDFSDYLGTFLIIIGLIIAASGGIGGGGILVPLLILVFNFKPKYAIPLSNFTIFGGSITNMILNIPKRHPDVDRPLVDWSLITVMQPLTLAGAIGGAYLGKLFPEWLLSVLLVVLLGYTAKRTLEKGFSQYKKETVKNAEQKKSALIQVKESDAELIKKQEGQSLLDSEEQDDENDDQDEENSSILSKPRQHDNLNEGLKKILEDEKKTPKEKVKWVVIMFVVVIFLNLIKGGGSLRSPLGIECGSTAYWGFSILILVWVLGVSLYMRSMLIQEWRLKARVRYRYIEGDVEWDERNTIIYPIICILAGFFAGMFGIGGGIVFGPMMLEMGVHPMVAASTSAVMIFFTAVAATTSYIAFGTLTYDYAFFLFFFGITATAVGQIGVGYLVNKYKRFSLISLSIGIAVGLSAVLMALQSVIGMMAEDSVDDTSICGK